MYRFMRSTTTTLALIMVLVISTLPPAPLQAQSSFLAAPVSEVTQTRANRVYLPLLVRAPGPPEILISNPAPGSTIGGTVIVAAQVQSPGSVSSVSFRAGNLDLGTDTSLDDGFMAFLDTTQLPGGPVTITATARGPQGEASQSINVIAQPNPPASGTVSNQGGVFGSPSGATITIPPGAVSSTANVRIRERTQAEVTADTGIEWDDIGVTFLGDILIDTDQPFNRPVDISTLGFAGRIQPGQAVVTYNLLPDRDNDGVGELVVVSTAAVAPNGAIISTPRTGITVEQVTRVGSSAALAQAASIKPGTLLNLRGSGFNPVSARGNIATFRSTASGEVIELPVIVADTRADGQQTVALVVPALPAGPATLTLYNASSAERTAPIELLIEAATPLIRPAHEIIDQWLVATIAYFDELPTSTPEERAAFTAAMAQFAQARRDLATLVAAGPNAVEQKALNDAASIIQNSDLFTVDAALAAYTSRDAAFSDVLGFVGGVVGTVGAVAAFSAAAPPMVAFATGMAIGLGIVTTAYFACKLIRGGSCFDDPTPPPPPPPTPPSPTGCTIAQTGGGGGGGGTSRGIGGAPPPGGNLCGNVAGGGGGNAAALAQVGASSLAGRYLVRVFPQSGGRALSPFTGATDAGGYFFLPFVPRDEPFRAIAVDTVTGATSTFEGVGPDTGASVVMFFDFSAAVDNRFPIAIGATVSDGVPAVGAGNLENPGAFDSYSFEAEPDRQVRFELIERADGLSNTRWRLISPSGSTVFDRVVGTTAIITLPEPGTYTLTVGDDNQGGTGTYSFRLEGIPLPDRFNIAIGDTISNGVPGPGAGNIEQPLVKDIYTFTAAAGQTVFVDKVNIPSGMGQIRWTLLDSADETIFSTCLGCTNPGRQTLTRGGTYRLIVGSDTSTITGTYSFRLLNVPVPQQFSITIGNTVSDGVPSAGAGNIESPGVQDIYTFTAAAGQTIFVDKVNIPSGMGQIRWTLVSPTNETIFSTCLGCTNPGRFTLSEGGTYTLTVGSSNNPDIGTYSFRVLNVAAPQQFSITPGDTISNGVPSAGAGNIESPGVQDIYTFTAAAGQTIFVDKVNIPSGMGQIRWTLVSPTNETIFSTCLGCTNPGRFTLSEGGTYTLTVESSNNPDTGTYSFRILDVPAP